MKKPENKKHKLELADILSFCKKGLIESGKLCSVQEKALEDITTCRTSAKGGHISSCTNCGHKEQSYNSCRNRHCPKCQFIKQEQWVDKLKGRLLPGRYFHIVFTLPGLLRPLFYINQQACYDILFQSAKEALLKAGSNPNFLGADVGAVAVLHTWGQNLIYHPHIHMLVPAGGLSEDGIEWIPAPKKYFAPQKALAAIFRGAMVRRIGEEMSEAALQLPEKFPNFKELKQQLYLKGWNVKSKKAFGGINSVLQYLGRYTHRVAISNSRLKSMENGKVTFSYKNNRNNGLKETMELDAMEFARRFLWHILPSGFYKIRYIGILATRHIYGKREQAIALVGKTLCLPLLEGLNAYEVVKILLGKEPLLCPVCKKGIMTKDIGLVQRE